jgi:hypothetical protein
VWVSFVFAVALGVPDQENDRPRVTHFINIIIFVDESYMQKKIDPF